VNLTLYLRVLSTEARKRMSYRGDFWIQAIATFLAEAGMLWFLWRAVYAASGATRIGGFSFEAMVLYSFATVLLSRLVRGREWGEGNVSQDIYDGSLSRYLVYPASYLGIKYAQHLGSLVPTAIHLFLFGALVLFVFDVPPDVRITPTSVLMGLVATGAANLLYFTLSWPIQSVAFWADNVWSLSVAERIATGLLGGALFPLTVFPASVNAVLDWLPFRWLFMFPAEALLGRTSGPEYLLGLGASLAWALGIHLLGRVVWRRGDLRYTGVGI
jgi:ABC-2 type transport system permease protein